MIRAATHLHLALLAALILTACSAGDDAPKARDRVRVVVLPFLTMAPLHIAAEEGYFEEQDLDVEYVRLTRNIEAVAALARGDLDVGVGQLTVNLLNTIANGERIRLIAGSGYLEPEGCTFNAALARRELVEASGLDTAEELRGRRFELEVVVPQGFWVSRMLAPLGLTIDDLEVENLPPPAAMEALVRGSLDLAIVSEPYLSQALESPEVVVWRRTEQAVPGFQLSTVMFGPTLLDERPEIGQRFIAAFFRGLYQLAQGKTARNLEILEKATGLSKARLTAACWPSFHQEGQIHVDGMSDYQEWAVSRGLIDRVLDEEELVDRRFVERANAALDR